MNTLHIGATGATKIVHKSNNNFFLMFELMIEMPTLTGLTLYASADYELTEIMQQFTIATFITFLVQLLHLQ